MAADLRTALPSLLPKVIAWAVSHDPEWDVSAQPAPEYEFDQRNAW